MLLRFGKTPPPATPSQNPARPSDPGKAPPLSVGNVEPSQVVGHLARATARLLASHDEFASFTRRLTAISEEAARPGPEAWRTVAQRVLALEASAKSPESSAALGRILSPVFEGLISAAYALGTKEPGASMEDFASAIPSMSDSTHAVGETLSFVDRLTQGVGWLRGARDALQSSLEEVVGAVGELAASEPEAQTKLKEIARAIASADGHDLERLRGALLAETQNLIRVATIRNERLVAVQGRIQKARDKVSNLEAALANAKAAAQVDPLTGVGNRRALDEAIKKLSKASSSAGVLALDIDHFKKINDEYGHDAGDAVLRVMSQVAQSELTGEERIFRTGGEEFIVLLPKSTLESARATAERLRERIRKDAVKHKKHSIAVRTSIGVSLWGAGSTFDAALKLADQALYDAKRNGRDRVSIRPASPAREGTR